MERSLRYKIVMLTIGLGLSLFSIYYFKVVNPKALQKGQKMVISGSSIQPAVKGMATKAYMVIDNKGNVADLLLKVTSNIAEKVELRKTVERNGVLKEVSVESVLFSKIEAQTFSLKGTYIALQGLKKSLQEGDKVTLTLFFQHGKNMKIQVPVKKVI
ncbi:MAG: copper(I)-binding protein [bacterium]|jgi:copper(I)-binding protein